MSRKKRVSGNLEATVRATREPMDRAMSRYAEGDDSAFDEVWSALAPRLEAFMGRICGSEVLAQDLVQETFLRMHRARRSFVRDRAVVPWAYAIARNCFTSYARTGTTKRARASLDISEHEVAAGPEASAEEATSAREAAEVVARVLGGMSAIYREAFVLTRIEGESIADAAQILGAREATVKVRVFRANERLREALDHMNRPSLRMRVA